jgi:TolB protein
MRANFPASPVKILSLLIAASLLVVGCAKSDPITPTLVPTFAPLPTNTLPPVINYNGDGNIAFISIEENGYAHLFAYQPKDLPLTRITTSDWNDIYPALSPDHTQIAFASNRNGYYDLYVMNVETGDVAQITDSPEYDSAPSWSPDSQWLAFETYANDNLEIAIVSVNDRTQPIAMVTEDPASDHSPVWAPDGRHVAFISSRGGDSDVWLANLDLTGEDRYQNLSNTPLASENHPLWNDDGSQLLWSSTSQTIGFSGLYIWDAKNPEREARWISDGIWGAWNPAADQLMAITNSANTHYITYYDVKGNLIAPPVPLHGMVRGLAWGPVQMPNPFPNSFAQAAAYSPPALWSPAVTPAADVPNKRWSLVKIRDVQAPYPQLHDLVDESFNALRERVIAESGWDALASIENAFVPLTTNLEPGLEEDWLYTGRAFAINTLMSNAGWLVTVREDVGAQTYWRVYIRCAEQDGTLGEPIHNAPWNLNARYDLDPRKYEQGGEYARVPAGYWVDFTALAAAYGWERLPSLPNWRTYYAGARFTEFTLTNGLDWYSAMLELYPAEALVTPTRVLPPTITPSRTPTVTPTLKVTRTPRPTGTPTITFTPTITRTPTVTFTPTITRTPTITLTPTVTLTLTSTITLTPTPPTVIP